MILNQFFNFNFISIKYKRKLGAYFSVRLFPKMDEVLGSNPNTIKGRERKRKGVGEGKGEGENQ